MSLRSSIDRALLRAMTKAVRSGRLSIEFPDGRRGIVHGAAHGPSADVTVHDTRIMRRLALSGAIGLADGYIEGDYDSPDLARLIEFAAIQLEAERRVVPESLDRAAKALWRRLGDSASHRGPLSGVVEHYDLGNEFYKLWLDETMTYSSGVFTRDDMPLEAAQREKYRRLAEATGIREGEHVLDIGCGWGGFAVHAAEELGCRVTAITISQQQRDFVDKLIAERGLNDRVEVRLEDFRHTRGTYERVVSIEMIESIPRSMWGPYVRRLRQLTDPGGTIGLQVITVSDAHWRSSNENPDFVRRYVFPGGQVPSIGMLRGLARSNGLAWLEDHGYGRSYAKTLRAWRDAFEDARTEVTALGFDERFRRMWRYYLAYCEGGFASGRTDVRQIVLAPTT
ncbi:MAG: cyclopropane-fatty-acyl-phospholipid synthase family protein [Actinomycetota bacterium]|nr:cyclopropane-fatty-acyl-phospholipid synthase family protein [Actinomycetota bacterium]